MRIRASADKPPRHEIIGSSRRDQDGATSVAPMKGRLLFFSDVVSKTRLRTCASRESARKNDNDASRAGRREAGHSFNVSNAAAIALRCFKRDAKARSLTLRDGPSAPPQGEALFSGRGASPHAERRPSERLSNHEVDRLAAETAAERIV